MRAMLRDRLTAPVRVGDAGLAAVAQGVDRFVELGPGRVLSGLVRRVRRDLPAVQVGEPGDLPGLAEAISVASGGAR